MISAELEVHVRPVVVLRRHEGANPGAWALLQEALQRGVVGGSHDVIESRVDVFFAELEAVADARRRFHQRIEFGDELGRQLRALAEDRKKRARVLEDTSVVAPEDLAAELAAAGFRRELKPFQLENLARLTSLPHGADFSVPGAGKTTVALAGFALNRARGDVEQLLVIGPIAAFQAWKEDAAVCLSPKPVLEVHAGPRTLLRDDLDILLTNYNRVASDYDRIRAYISRRPTQVVLDEAHRIKKGEAGVHGRAVLDLAFAARRRDVLTGTPAPQGANDLVAPMRFLYPGQDRKILPRGAYTESNGRDPDVVAETSAAIHRYFVRTPKSRLGLPPTEFEIVAEPMGRLQKAIYEALEGRYRGEFALAVKDRRDFSRLGRIMMYLLEAATNPALLVAGSDEHDQSEFAHPPLELRGDEALADLLRQYAAYESPWKYDRVREIVEGAAARGEKVLVWSTFVRNLKLLSSALGEFRPAVVHGGVRPADGAPPGALTRDAEFDRFRNDPDCHVLLANPAACGEGISLHHWCHQAVYLDRTFNAGHYLQSQDRIHRLGLREDVVTRFTLLLSDDSIDETVNGRLRDKIVVLSQLMNDPGLVTAALPEPDTDESVPAVVDDDATALLRALQRRS
ncbi:DEAD/DEAH box helicase [Streptomyces sp. NBC_01275]|uniref:DEAD/DEAH box helicase n=1 Tax=Streptomyces sp. NBC_01275 TaxID=2903807 RepID=UPI0022552478|nr:DEAD/DEAH box helicase [Streptomyces sp. NBC_01275]MCX4762427.1 DEAD/DEAH box helicase [Streptomyces sp. NBC_01275]